MRAFLRRFFSDPKGNVAILFALAVVPVIGSMGAAVDYSMASAQRVSMQAAVDATTLALAKIMPATQTELDARGKEWFEANMGPTPLTNVTLTISGVTGKLTVEARGIYHPELISVLGTSAFPVSAKAEVKWGSTRLRVALVLDVTGSMSSAGKMSAMQTAAKNLINQLKGVATQTGDVYISIVPFNKDVAVAKSNHTATWVDWDDWDSVNGTCSPGNFTTEATCENGVVSACSKPQYNTKKKCQKNNGIWSSTSGTWNPKPHSTWNGCITDRDKDPVATANYDTKNTAPTTLVPGTLFPAEQFADCPEPVMGLSYDWNALTNKINALSPKGNTNQAIGLAWGWQSLTNAPFTVPPLDPGFTYKQVIILLTDGLNTENRWYTSAASINARQKLTCDNVNAAGITLYTVQVNTGGDPTSTLLQNCAGSPGKYPDSNKFFLLTSGSQIITTFQQIATELANMHLSQ